ncbi:MAG: sigma-70 family RNA polymerase sigma factor [Pseudomonadota bacterium]
MPRGVQPSRDSSRDRRQLGDADKTAAHSAALERLRDTQDRLAFEELYVYFAPRLIVFFERRGLEPRRSQEIMQDVMAKIWEKAPLFDASKASAPTWIFTLARNQLIDVIRKEKRSEIDYTDPALKPHEPASPDQALQSKERELALQKAIASLPEDQAVVLTGIYIDGMKQAALADKLGIPLNTIKSRLRLALNKIRTSMEVGQ